MSKLILGGDNSSDLNNQELNYILKVLSESKFEGKDVLVLADIVNKLTNKLK
jgi:hypothetical protein